ncbi:MAG: DNA-processing protein DprA [Bacillota bacterium]|nr:DNA-processing protein DprA [Bacillota bacterium]
MKRVFSERADGRPSVSPKIDALFGIGRESYLSDRVLIAMVGSRDPSDYGRRAADYIASYLVQRGVVVVSGLARGIDALVHYKALEQGGKTIGVSAVSPFAVYPARNTELYRRMRSEGLIVSEHKELERPSRYHFPMRNRIIAAISDGVIVVEAGIKSGALITARYAAEFGIPVFAVPGSIFSQRSGGCHRLIEEGAHPLYELDQLEAMYCLERRHRESATGERAQEISDYLRLRRQASFSEILNATNLDLPDLVSGLEELVQEGLVISLPGDRYQWIDA